MDLTRRQFLVMSGAAGAGVALSSLGLDLGPVQAYAEELKKTCPTAAALNADDVGSSSS